MANKVYSKGLEELANGDLDWVNATDVKVALMETGYTFDDDHDFWDDVSGDEVSDASYAAGGQALGNKSVTRDTGNNQVELDADDEVFSSLDVVNPYSAIVYRDTGTPATSPLIAYFDTDFPFTANGGDVTISFGADGVVKLASA